MYFISLFSGASVLKRILRRDSAIIISPRGECVYRENKRESNRCWTLFQRCSSLSDLRKNLLNVTAWCWLTAVGVCDCTVRPVLSVFGSTFIGESDGSASCYTHRRTRTKKKRKKKSNQKKRKKKKHLLLTSSPLQWLALQQTRPRKKRIQHLLPQQPTQKNNVWVEAPRARSRRGGGLSRGLYCTVGAEAGRVPGMTESMQTGAWPRRVKPKFFFPL